MELNENNFFSFRVMGEVLVPKELEDYQIETKENFVQTKQNDSIISFQRDCYHEFNQSLQSIEEIICALKITQKETDSIYNICKRLIKTSEILYKKLMESVNPKEAISEGTRYIHNRLSEKDSVYKRNNLLQERVNHVAPIESPIGLKWKTTIDPTKTFTEHKLVQVKFPHVPISDSIKAMFSDENFKRIYFEYNLEKKHESVQNIYRDFCCGQIFKQHQIFKSPLTLQIQIGIDDFDPGDALKSRAGNQKMCGVYFEIRNIPPEFSSKLNTRKLVALAKVPDIKESKDEFHSVLRPIVQNLKLIETVGIPVDDFIISKALW